MTRILLFDWPRGPKRFELLYVALLNGGDGKGDRSASVIRKEARLLDQLDAISEPNPGATNGNPDRRLKAPSTVTPPPVVVSVSQEDHDLLTQYAEKTPWSPRASREAVDLWDWLSAAEKKD